MVPLSSKVEEYTAVCSVCCTHSLSGLTDAMIIRGVVNTTVVTIMVFITSNSIQYERAPLFFIYLLRQMAAHIKYTNQYTKNTQYTV